MTLSMPPAQSSQWILFENVFFLINVIGKQFGSNTPRQTKTKRNKEVGKNGKCKTRDEHEGNKSSKFRDFAVFMVEEVFSKSSDFFNYGAYFVRYSLR